MLVVLNFNIQLKWLHEPVAPGTQSSFSLMITLFFTTTKAIFPNEMSFHLHTVNPVT